MTDAVVKSHKKSKGNAFIENGQLIIEHNEVPLNIKDTVVKYLPLLTQAEMIELFAYMIYAKAAKMEDWIEILGNLQKHVALKEKAHLDRWDKRTQRIFNEITAKENE